MVAKHKFLTSKLLNLCGPRVREVILQVIIFLAYAFFLGSCANQNCRGIRSPVPNDWGFTPWLNSPG